MLKAQMEAVRADKWVAKQPDQNWVRTCVRDAAKDKLVVDTLSRQVWLWDAPPSGGILSPIERWIPQRP